jgi:hypothetical protein
MEAGKRYEIAMSKDNPIINKLEFETSIPTPKID